MTGTSERPKVGVEQSAPPQVPRVLTSLRHGDHVAGDEVTTVDPTGRLEDSAHWAKVKETSTPFGYMFRDLQGRYPPAHLPVEPATAVVAGTPLWFYVLREAEVLEAGERLGPVGSRIVTETIIGQLRADPSSFINQGWEPTKGVITGTASTDLVDTTIAYLRFAGMHPETTALTGLTPEA
jgi:hypothetical protein